MAAGGPGALFWMWVIGFLGMALKTVEITQALMFRKTDHPQDPHGGAMWVIERTWGQRGGAARIVAKLLGATFAVATIVSTITGGNMFQAWNVAELTARYFGTPRPLSGGVLAFLVGLVILGGVKRIGHVTGRLVPVMCGFYIVAVLAVLAMHAAEVPGLLLLVVQSAFSTAEAGGAFMGGRWVGHSRLACGARCSRMRRARGRDRSRTRRRALMSRRGRVSWAGWGLLWTRSVFAR